MLVKEVILPPSSLLNRWHDSSIKIVLQEAICDPGTSVFLVVKFMNRFRNRFQYLKDKTIEIHKDIEPFSNLNDLIGEEEQNKILRVRS